MAIQRQKQFAMIEEELEEFRLDNNPDIREALNNLHALRLSERQLEVVWQLLFHTLYTMKHG